jgi:hypothetical protein
VKPSLQSFLQATRRLRQALQRETALARTGALPELAQASAEKRVQFAAFSFACAGRQPPEQASETEREAVRELLAAADENMLVLEAVRVTLDDFADKVRKSLSSAADPGTYGPTQQRRRHVLAARLDASA